MNERTIFLRLMLWSLGLAAVGGVFVVLTQRTGLAWRTVGTGLLSAVACALLIPASLMGDRKKTRAAGLLGMGTVVLDYVLVLAIIWEVPRRLTLGGLADEILGTAGLLAIGAAVVMIWLRLLHERSWVIASQLGMGFTVGGLGAFLVQLWSPYNFWGKNYAWVETGWAILACGLLAMLASVGLGAEVRRPWRALGVAASAVALAMWTFEVWVGRGSDLGFAVFTGCLCCAAVVAHANMVLYAPGGSSDKWVRMATIAAALLTACLIEAVVVKHRFFAGPWQPNLGRGPFAWDFLERLSTATGIVAGCGTLAVAVLARVHRGVDTEGIAAGFTELTIICPRCRKKQLLGVGDSACSDCKLRISIRVEEPRCITCGYLLYKLTSDRCPECGTPIGTDPQAGRTVTEAEAAR